MSESAPAFDHHQNDFARLTEGDRSKSQKRATDVETG
jgi:hypothetical protein